MPDPRARAILLNRILVGLGFVGLFISGYLSLVKILKVLPACGAGGGGCLAVTDAHAAYWFGYPVAYYGFAGYLAIGGLAILRELTGAEVNRPLVGLGFLLSLVGLFASFWLQFVALAVIGEKCWWCLSSAATMFATFVVHALLFARASEVEGARSEPRVASLPFVVAGLVVTAAAIGLWPKSGGARTQVAKVSDATQFVPERANVLGDANAPVTVVEFADFCCPLCRQTAMSSRELVKRYPGKVRFVFRHFPLPLEGHEMNYPLAVASEYAARRGKFWPFHEAAMAGAEPPKTVEEVLTIAKNVGLDVAELTPILEEMNGAEFDNVFRDASAAPRLGATGTPTFFVLVNGQPPKLVKPDALDAEFESGEFAAYVK